MKPYFWQIEKTGISEAEEGKGTVDRRKKSEGLLIQADHPDDFDFCMDLL